MAKLALLAALVALAPLPLAFTAPHGQLRAVAVPLDPTDPGRVQVGRLRYRGGWVLHGSDRGFGGISSMTIQDGRFTLLSDTGTVTQFRFSGSGPQREYRLFPLPDGPGTPLRKVNRDSESSTFDPASGHVWAGFETRNAIWRYTRGFAAADGHATPPAMADWPANEGAEAMVRLHDGRFLVFAETMHAPNGHALLLLFPGDPVEGAVPARLSFRAPDGFAPTDAAELPDGRVLVLLRRFQIGAGLLSGTLGFSAALAIIDPRAAKAGDDLAAAPVARLAPPLTVDNMEALAVEPRDGRLLVWIASDDNFLALQRTLLLCFELRD
ncbi:esterase-like activity of phytase family protein [Sphingomonas morindae]|uniref:Esterase-like activity of phytase family protein n=1 Tax=Sphingomonas morindae TaxID=1541170 RepID=A0ABY4X8W3_9SPHN|nr:esterase-like activity of phytase family protein [Sphingomonas morindae]USI73345.1 esterase-like activity of phytase family protein [Sphingomonas morindae]